MSFQWLSDVPRYVKPLASVPFLEAQGTRLSTVHQLASDLGLAVNTLARPRV